MSETVTDTLPAPHKRDPEGRRRAILRAATELIVTKGPAALTHRGVASHAGVSLGSTTQYFASLDELRETALAELAQEIDESLAQIERRLETSDIAKVLAAEMLGFLRDRRTVRADVALMTSAMTEPRLRELALRWSDRLIEILTEHIGKDRATAIALYADGATVHAALHDEHMSESAMRAVFQALIDSGRDDAEHRRSDPQS